MAAAAAVLLQRAHEACVEEHAEDVRVLELTTRVMRRYVRKLRQQAERGGPRRAGKLRAIDALCTAARAGGQATSAWATSVATSRRALVHASGTAAAGFLQPLKDWRGWLLLACATRWRLRAWQRLHVETITSAWSHETLVQWAGAGAGGVVLHTTTTAAELRKRAELAATRGTPPRAVREACRQRSEAARKRRVAGRPLRAWSGGQSVRGGALPEVGQMLYVDCGHGRARRGQKRRAQAARARSIARGSAEDDRGAWEVARLVEVRRRATRGGLSLEVLVEWVSPDSQEPYDDSWVPLTRKWLPTPALYSEARAMWAAQQAGGGGGAAHAAHDAAEVPDATRPGGESWGRALRQRKRRVTAPIAADVDDAEEAELRRLEGRGDTDGDSDDAAAEEVEDVEDAEVSDGGELAELLAEVRARGERRDGLRAAAHERTVARMDVGIRVHAGLKRHLLGEGPGGGTDEGAGTSGNSERGDAAPEGAAGQAVEAPPRAARRQRRRAPTTEATCSLCRAELHGPLCAHSACIAAVLGWNDSGRCGGSGAALAELCRAPAPATLSGLLTEADVRPDGSCWDYAMLLWHGMAPHAVTAARRPRRAWRAGRVISNESFRFTMMDRLADCAMRRALGRRMRATNWAEEHAQVFEERSREFRVPTAAEAGETIRAVEYRLPTGGEGSERPTRYGKFGGEGEFSAAADVLGMAIVTMTATQQTATGDRERVLVAAPSGEEGRTGTCENMTVDAMLRRCLQHGWAARVAVFQAEGRHYHPLVPVDATGKVIYRPLPPRALSEWSEAGRGRMRQWLEAYDAAGGYADGTDATLGEAPAEVS